MIKRIRSTLKPNLRLLVATCSATMILFPPLSYGGLFGEKSFVLQEQRETLFKHDKICGDINLVVDKSASINGSINYIQVGENHYPRKSKYFIFKSDSREIIPDYKTPGAKVLIAFPPTDHLSDNSGNNQELGTVKVGEQQVKTVMDRFLLQELKVMAKLYFDNEVKYLRNIKDDELGSEIFLSRKKPTSEADCPSLALIGNKIYSYAWVNNAISEKELKNPSEILEKIHFPDKKEKVLLNKQKIDFLIASGGHSVKRMRDKIDEIEKLIFKDEASGEETIRKLMYVFPDLMTYIIDSPETQGLRPLLCRFEKKHQKLNTAKRWSRVLTATSVLFGIAGFAVPPLAAVPVITTFISASLALPADVANAIIYSKGKTSKYHAGKAADLSLGMYQELDERIDQILNRLKVSAEDQKNLKTLLNSYTKTDVVRAEVEQNIHSLLSQTMLTPKEKEMLKHFIEIYTQNDPVLVRARITQNLEQILTKNDSGLEKQKGTLENENNQDSMQKDKEVLRELVEAFTYLDPIRSKEYKHLRTKRLETKIRLWWSKGPNIVTWPVRLLGFVPGVGTVADTITLGYKIANGSLQAGPFGVRRFLRYTNPKQQLSGGRDRSNAADLPKHILNKDKHSDNEKNTDLVPTQISTSSALSSEISTSSAIPTEISTSSVINTDTH